MDERMIARQDAYIEKTDVWAKLSAPVPSGVISWRQDGKVTAREGKYFARFVAYIEANTVRERLDEVVPGEWDLTLDLMPVVVGDDGDGAQCSFKARLQVLGVIREDIGTGRDYKSASTDAFKRAAVRFGIAHELYAYEQNWVEMDGEGKYAKPVEDPQAAYARRYGKPAPSSSLTDVDTVSCPKCGGRMWDNRLTKRNSRAPDYKCQNRSCDGVIWPPRQAAASVAPEQDQNGSAKSSALFGAGEEALPF
jgi:hypothetical protein